MAIFRSTLSILVLAFAALASGDDAPLAPQAVVEDKNVVAEDHVISQLTIAMASEVVDEQTFAIRDSSKGSSQIHVRLGNTAPTAQGSLDDGEYAEKKKVAKEALSKLVDRQMIWYKLAPSTVQPQNASGAIPMVFADVWSIDGKHLSSVLKNGGHLSEAQDYSSEIAKDILTVAAEVEKKESYKKLEEALKESEKAKQDAAKASRSKAAEEEAAANVEGFNLADWIGMAVALLLVIGAATNFGRASSKKVNLNRKKGVLERFWMQFKSA